MTPKRSKSWGYEVEVAALSALRARFPNLRRTGSMAYSKAAADLVQDGQGQPIRVIVTRDKRRALLATMSVTDLSFLMLGDNLYHGHVVVQVKGRERTWIGSLYDALKVATS